MYISSEIRTALQVTLKLKLEFTMYLKETQRFCAVCPSWQKSGCRGLRGGTRSAEHSLTFSPAGTVGWPEPGVVCRTQSGKPFKGSFWSSLERRGGYPETLGSSRAWNAFWAGRYCSLTLKYLFIPSIFTLPFVMGSAAAKCEPQ